MAWSMRRRAISTGSNGSSTCASCASRQGPHVQPGHRDQHHGDDAEAVASGDGDGDGGDGTGHPAELEAGLEAGERPAVGRARGAGLHEGVEALPADGGRRAEDDGDEQHERPRRPERAEPGDDGEGDERPGGDAVLAVAPPQQRGDGAATERSDAVGGHGGAVHPCRLALAPEGEGQPEHEEPDGGAHDRERPRRGDDRRRVQLLVLDAREGHVVGADLGQSQRGERGADERRAGQAERGGRGASGGEDRRADRTADRAGQHGEAGEARVGGDELVGLVDERRHERLAHDARRLGGDEQGEGEEVQGQVEEGEGQRRGADGAQGEQERGDPAVARAEAVDGRTDQRRQEGERRHVDDEVQQHLLAGGVRAQAEEQRPGEGDGHERVGGAGQRLGLGEAVEPRSPDDTRRQPPAQPIEHHHPMLPRMLPPPPRPVPPPVLNQSQGHIWP